MFGRAKGTVKFARSSAPFALGLAALLAGMPSAAFPDGEKIGVLGSDCATPQLLFTLGDSVCAFATGVPVDLAPPRRFEWIAPNGTVFQLGPGLFSDQDRNSITLPTSGSFAQPGTWTVKTVDVSNNGYATTQFMVRDLNNAAVDLAAGVIAPSQVWEGSNVTFALVVSNNGPNEAQNVLIKTGAAGDTTFLSANQVSGPSFTWTVVPNRGVEPAVCIIDSLPVNTSASFNYVYRTES